MIYRNITSKIVEALQDTPVILINGARQTGKSTLAQWLSKEKYPAEYLTLDDATVLAAARQSPQDFIANARTPVIIDEIQRAPELFLSIKSAVDRNRQPGQFLLTGSANVMLLPRLAESLAGRMEIVTLWPFSQGELAGVREQFIDLVFAPEWRMPRIEPIDNKSLWERVLRGGYPESVERGTQPRRKAWFGSYVTSILQRDIRDIANIEGLTALPRLLKLLASRTASLLNFSELSRAIGIPQSTLKRYMTLLETTFMYRALPAWSANLSKRLVKSPKIILGDTGLIGYLQDINIQRVTRNPEFSGRLLENFVMMELVKQSTWSETQPGIFYYRTHSGQEVDIVLEDAAGNVVGIEVKASSAVGSGDFKGLRDLEETLDDRFVRGVVLYTGEKAVPFGEKLFAIPVSGIWSGL